MHSSLHESQLSSLAITNTSVCRLSRQEAECVPMFSAELTDYPEFKYCVWKDSFERI